MNSRVLTVTIHHSLRDFSQMEWNALTDPNTPFLDHEFLSALESTACIGGNSGWLIRFIAAHTDGQLVGIIPIFEKHHLYGEFLYDWEWHAAYSRAGLPYYPKGFWGSPFTPASGPKFLGNPDVLPQLIPVLIELSQRSGWHSIHAAFVTKAEQSALTDQGFIPRTHYQYYWQNRSYSSFDDFLSTLKSSRRKQIKKERRSIADSGLDIQVKYGPNLTQSEVDALFEFYLSTHDKRQGHPHLTRTLFHTIVQLMPDRVVAVLAYRGTFPVAGTFNFIKGTKLYGRYWGCTAEIPNLHFECCYYQLIELAIQKGLVTVEAGAMGDHKFLRGFDPEPTYYAHLFALPEGHEAVKNHAIQEALYIADAMDQLKRTSAYKYE